MEDLAFYSLPFEIRKTFRTPFFFSTSIMAEYLANLFDAKYYLGINILNSFTSYTQEDITEFEHKFDFIQRKTLYHDVDYGDKVGKIIHKLFDLKAVTIKKEETGICECGRIEITKSEVERFKNDGKYFALAENCEDKLVCKICHKELKFSEKEGLFLNFDEEKLNQIMNVQPDYLNSDFNYFRKKLNGSSFRFSRERNTGAWVELEGKKFFIDVDMQWKLIPFCLEEKNIVVVSSVKHNFQLFLMNYIAKILETKNLSFVGLPFVDLSAIDAKTMEFLNEHRNSLKLLVALGIGWNKKEIALEKSTCKYFMSSKERNEELYNYIYNKKIDVDDFAAMRKQIVLNSSLQIVNQMVKKEKEANNKQ